MLGATLLCRLEENDKLVLTPFEKNIDIWRQLWRVVERSDLVRTALECIMYSILSEHILSCKYTALLCSVILFCL
jgi:hypothetical protein